MQKVSETYRRLLKTPGVRTEVMAVIAGEEYREDRIVNLNTNGGLFSKPGLGNCSSRQMDLTVLQPGAIPKSAEIKLFIRLCAEEETSEWIPKGVFFISSRERNKRTGALSIHGYDAMRKASQVWLNSDYDLENWPMSQRAAAEDIADRMGVELDERTALRTDFPVGYPIDENGDLEMIDVLEGIAASNAGNWIITDAGKLLLVGYGDIPPETNYLVDEYGDNITLGGVRILIG